MSHLDSVRFAQGFLWIHNQSRKTASTGLEPGLELGLEPGLEPGLESGVELGLEPGLELDLN